MEGIKEIDKVKWSDAVDAVLKAIPDDYNERQTISLMAYVSALLLSEFAVRGADCTELCTSYSTMVKGAVDLIMEEVKDAQPLQK